MFTGTFTGSLRRRPPSRARCCDLCAESIRTQRRAARTRSTNVTRRCSPISRMRMRFHLHNTRANRRLMASSVRARPRLSRISRSARLESYDGSRADPWAAWAQGPAVREMNDEHQGMVRAWLECGVVGREGVCDGKEGSAWLGCEVILERGMHCVPTRSSGRACSVMAVCGQSRPFGDRWRRSEGGVAVCQ